MAGNPRNNTATKETVTQTEGGSVDSSNWKTLTLGSLALKGNDGKLLREGMASFTINNRNAAIIKDAADFIMNNPDKKVTISAGVFYEDANISDNVKRFYSHRLYISAASVAKWGKKLADYVTSKG